VARYHVFQESIGLCQSSFLCIAIEVSRNDQVIHLRIFHVRRNDKATPLHFFRFKAEKVLFGLVNMSDVFHSVSAQCVNDG